ncbi:hypothetical protein Aca07nite_85150 [Actinoplanes capillaceus]|uniref:Fucose permease n=1 Tax=Actinoplanes campanulatus TaxID=113559 RepID=A0ABQ3WYM1_9ACTN|nr:hypothetical protein Aca07nite_85150 [Actinoplanes capillaceus]
MSTGLRVGTAQAALGFLLTGLGACLVILARDLAIPIERLTWLSTSFGMGLIAVAATGPVLLRAGPDLPLRAGALTTATGATVLALAPDLAMATIGTLLIGLGGAGIVLATPALLTGPDAVLRLTRVSAAASTAAVLSPAAIGALDAAGASGRLAMLIVVPPLLPLIVPARGTVPTDPPGRTQDRPALGSLTRRWTRIVLAVAVEFCFTIWAVARLQDTGVTMSTAAILGVAFPLGMAIGRLLGPTVMTRIPVVPAGAAVIALGAAGTTVASGPGLVTAALAVAGIGVAVLYPVTLAELTRTPGLRPAHAAPLGALASGIAIITAPAALAALADRVELRGAFLITLPLLAALLILRPRSAPVDDPIDPATTHSSRRL